MASSQTEHPVRMINLQKKYSLNFDEIGMGEDSCLF